MIISSVDSGALITVAVRDLKNSTAAATPPIPKTLANPRRAMHRRMCRMLRDGSSRLLLPPFIHLYAYPPRVATAARAQAHRHFPTHCGGGVRWREDRTRSNMLSRPSGKQPGGIQCKLAAVQCRTGRCSRARLPLCCASPVRRMPLRSTSALPRTAGSHSGTHPARRMRDKRK